jgi:hypothetical protein
MRTLHFVEFCATENNIGELVASCPNLEELILSRLLSFADITIHSTKLKVLRVDGMFKHLNLVTPHVSSAVINLQVNTGYVKRAGSNFNLSQFIGSLLDIENISLLGHAFEVRTKKRIPWFFLSHSMLGDTLLLYSVQHMELCLVNYQDR